MVEEGFEEQGDQNRPEEEDRSVKKVKLGDDHELNEKISKQLDYYFSDVNVIKDKFLLEEFKKNDGWVKLSVLLTFVRLKQLTTEEDRIVKALKDVESSIIELDESKKQVRRKEPVPDAAEYQKQLDLRTVHISGFPSNYDFDSLHRFCNIFGEVESLSMRRHFKTRFFKGCIHVTFKREADAKKVLDDDALMCKDRELRKESMEAYHKRKAEMRQRKKGKKNNFENKDDDKKDDDKSKS